MRKIIFVLSLILSTAAFAEGKKPVITSLPEDASAVSQITNGKVTETITCLEGHEDEECNGKKGTLVRMSFLLNGCLDKLLPLSYLVRVTGPEKNDIQLYVSAINLHTKGSQTAMCIAAPMATKSIFVGKKTGKVTVHFLKSVKTPKKK